MRTVSDELMREITIMAANLRKLSTNLHYLSTALHKERGLNIIPSIREVKEAHPKDEPPLPGL